MFRSAWPVRAVRAAQVLRRGLISQAGRGGRQISLLCVLLSFLRLQHGSCPASSTPSISPHHAVSLLALLEPARCRSRATSGPALDSVGWVCRILRCACSPGMPIRTGDCAQPARHLHSCLCHRWPGCHEGAPCRDVQACACCAWPSKMQQTRSYSQLLRLPGSKIQLRQCLLEGLLVCMLNPLHEASLSKEPEQLHG